MLRGSVSVSIMLGLAALAVLDSGSCAWGQSIATEAMARKLATTVQVPPAVLTLDALARQIERQTGAAIHPADYLLQHKMIVKANGLSAAALLNTVSEIYGWQWREMSDGTVSIDRPTARVPDSLLAVSVALHTALPPQLQRYLGYSPAEPTAVGEPPHLVASFLTLGGAPDPNADRFPNVSSPNNVRMAHIWPAVPARLQLGKALPFAEWDEPDRTRVLESVLGETFRISRQCLYYLESQRISYYIADPLGVTVSYDYAQDGRLQGILLMKKWVDVRGAARGMAATGIMAGVGFLRRNDETKQAEPGGGK
jgi:hypothetical protein